MYVLKREVLKNDVLKWTCGSSGPLMEFGEIDHDF